MPKPQIASADAAAKVGSRWRSQRSARELIKDLATASDLNFGAGWSKAGQMRRDDLILRGAAKRGDPRACLEIAQRFFSGANGFEQNLKLGLAYLQQELGRDSPPALLLAADCVPLEILISLDARELLERAAALGSALAKFKLGTWCVLELCTGRKAFGTSDHLD